MSTSPFEHTLASEGRSYALPLTYDHSFLTLLPKDPHCVFAQWDIHESHVPSTPAKEAGAFVLRMYDIHVPLNGAENGEASAPSDTNSAADVQPFVDFPVSPRHSMYIRLTEPGRTVAAQLGLLDEEFIPLLTSNVVTTPPGRPAHADESWRGAAGARGPMFQVGPAGAHWRGESRGRAGSSDFAWSRT